MFKKLLVVFALILAAGCSRPPAPPREGQKPIVLVSIAPYKFIVERIGSEAVEVKVVVPSNANPHSFEPTSHQVGEMTEAIAWFRIGEPFEDKIIPILKERRPDLLVQDLRDGIELIEEEGSLTCSHCSMDHLDRHVWMSPKLASAQAVLVQKALSGRFPEKRELFQANCERLLAELTFLDQEIHALLEPIQERVILVSHPAFGYFCNDYQFEQLSVEYEGKDPRPKHLEKMLQKAASQKAEVAIALPQYNNKGAQLIADKLNLPVRLIDPYSADYFETMRKLAHLIADPYETSHD